MATLEEYLKGVLKQIQESYQILLDLKDEPGDLEIIKMELLKINGFFQVIINKIESANLQSDTFVNLLKKSKNFHDNYEFEREIETMSQLYSTDSDRLKNIRLKIIEALEEKKLMETIEIIIKS